MPREAELTGIVRPEIDQQAAERETSRLSGLMDSAAHLSPTLDTSGLRREFEQAIPGGELFGGAIDSLTGRGGPSMDADRGDQSGGLGDATLQAAQLEKLEDIHETLEKSAVSGDGGGGSGGGGGLVSGVTGSLAVRGLLGGGSGGLLSGAAAGGTAGTAATLTGAGLVGGGLGLAGVAGLDQTGLFDQLRGAGQDVGSELGSDTTTSLLRGANTLSMGTLGGFSRLGAGALGTVRGEKGLGAESRKQVGQTFGNSSPIRALLDWEWPEYPALNNLSWPDVPDPSISVPSSLQDLSLETPDWMSKSGALGFETPSWLGENGDLSFETPSWIGENGNLGFDTPDWLGENGSIGFNTPDWLNEAGSLGFEIPDWLGEDGALNLETPGWLENGAINLNVPNSLQNLAEDIPGTNGSSDLINGPVYQGPDPINLGPNDSSGRGGGLINGPVWQGPDPLNLGGNSGDQSASNRATERQNSGINPQINVTQQVELGRGQIRQQMEQAFEQTRQQIVDDAVQQIESRLTQSIDF